MQCPIARNRAGAHWADLFCVLVVARSKSIKKAAAQLGVTESTVSRRVRRVEAALGLSIFERTPTGMAVSTAGEKLVQHLTRAEIEVEGGLEKATNQQNAPKGQVRLTSVPILINHLIIPAAKRLIADYPKIELELVGLPADLSLMRREADIAVRLGCNSRMANPSH